MKKILCFGDSNTFGFIPEVFKRYSKTERWTGVLSELLKGKYEVIEQGMNNRNGFIDNPDGTEFCGIKYLPTILQTYKDIDIFIVALGTNDVQFRYNFKKEDVFNGLEEMINQIKCKNNNTKIIIVPPVKINENINNGYFKCLFNQKSIATINKIYNVYSEIARKNNCYYLDFNEFVTPSVEDGLHYTKNSHNMIAHKLCEYIKSFG